MSTVSSSASLQAVTQVNVEQALETSNVVADLVRELDAGNLHVQFDERRMETE